MATTSPVLHEKVVSSLPGTLAANTIYFVRTGAGFVMYLTDSTGSVAYTNNLPAHSHTASEISDSTVVGRDLLKATDAAEARSTLGLSNHNLVSVDATGDVTLQAAKRLGGTGTTSGGWAVGPSFAATGSASLFGYGDTNAFCDLVPVPADGTSPAVVRMFRATNTTGIAGLNIFFGDNTSGVNHALLGKGGHSFLCRANGNLMIGTLTSNELDKLQVIGSVSSTGPKKHGQYTLTTLPSASAYSGYHIDVTNATGGPKLCRSDGTNWKIVNTNTNVS